MGVPAIVHPLSLYLPPPLVLRHPLHPLPSKNGNVLKPVATRVEKKMPFFIFAKFVTAKNFILQKSSNNLSFHEKFREKYQSLTIFAKIIQICEKQLIFSGCLAYLLLSYTKFCNNFWENIYLKKMSSCFTCCFYFLKIINIRKSQPLFIFAKVCQNFHKFSCSCWEVHTCFSRKFSRICENGSFLQLNSPLYPFLSL
jgi:hypothetical protein